MEAAQPAVITREVHLQELAYFCQKLCEALARAGFAQEQSLELFRAAISAECVRCGIRLSAEELFALAHRPSAEYATAKLGRLRLGDCARQGCQSYYYHFNFSAQPPIDWTSVLAEAQAQQEGAVKLGSRPGRPTAWKYLPRLVCNAHIARRAAIAFGALLLLLVARQLFLGGRIPFFREPEKFRVDPAPEHESSQPTPVRTE